MKPTSGAPVDVVSHSPVDALPHPRFDHLRRMTSRLGIWEHARYTTPRTSHGFCTDDNARALIVVCRQPDPSPDLLELGRTYLAFLEEAALPAGGFHNRRSADGSWTDRIGSDDSQGRAIWSLGSAVGSAPEAATRDAAARAVRTAAPASPHRLPAPMPLRCWVPPRCWLRARRPSKPGRRCRDGSVISAGSMIPHGHGRRRGSPMTTPASPRRSWPRATRSVMPTSSKQASVCSTGWFRSRRGTVTSASRLWAAGLRGSGDPASTSSRWRRRQWPTPATGHGRSPGMIGGESGCRAPPDGSLGRTTGLPFSTTPVPADVVTV